MWLSVSLSPSACHCWSREFSRAEGSCFLRHAERRETRQAGIGTQAQRDTVMTQSEVGSENQEDDWGGKERAMSPSMLWGLTVVKSCMSGTECVAQWGKHLPNNHEDTGSILSTAYNYHSRDGEEFKASLGYLRPYHRKKKSSKKPTSILQVRNHQTPAPVPCIRRFCHCCVIDKRKQAVPLTEPRLTIPI